MLVQYTDIKVTHTEDFEKSSSLTGTRKVDAAAANAMTWPDSVFSQTHYAGVQASFQNVPVSAGQDKPLPAAPRGAAAP